MRIKLSLPSPLKEMADEISTFEYQGKCIMDVLLQLQDAYPKLKGKILDADNQLIKGISIFINKQNTIELDGINTRVLDGDKIIILPIMAGG
jgi:molybdopterin converting factor small subunit